MARIKDRNHGIPYGYQWVEAQTNRQFKNDSFWTLVDELIIHRRGNMWIVKQHNLPLDRNQVADQVDEANAARMLAHPGWEHFVGSPEPPKTWSPSAFQVRQRGNAVGDGKIRKTAAGIALISQWLGQGLRPVENALAEQRAGRCVTCPENGDPNWLEKITGALAAEIKHLIEIRHDLKLQTIHDQNLYTCKPCQCFLKLKVHTPLEHIIKEMPPDVKTELSKVRTSTGDKCWVIEEGEKANV